MGRSQLEFVEPYAVPTNLSLIASIPIYRLFFFFFLFSVGKKIGSQELTANIVVIGVGKVKIRQVQFQMFFPKPVILPSC